MFKDKVFKQTSTHFSNKIKKIGITMITTLSFISGCGISGNADKADSRYYPGSLVDAVEQQDLAVIEKILQQPGYDMNEVNEQGKNAILVATALNNFEIARKLIDAGANVNMQDEAKNSAYLYAAEQGRTEILRYMLEHAQPEPNQKVYNRFGGNAIIVAAENGHLENVRLLLEVKHTNVNHQNDFGYTALIEAVALKDGSELYQDIVKCLIEAGAKTNVKDKTGRTALHYAQEKGYQAMVRLLIAAAQKEQDTTENNKQ